MLTVESLVSERIVVSGAAPDIEATPTAATTSLSHAELQTRLPSNLIQALENVAGVNQVSEGQAAVPAVRGLSGGRTLILIDGARVNSERRAGASATFLDPEVLESVEVARGPGSVAYGSDAFGGVIAVTTRKVAPSSPWAGRLSTTAGTGVPEWRVGADVSKGLEAGSLLVAAHGRRADDWTSPAGTVFNSGYRDIGVLTKVTHTVGDGYLSVGYQGDGGRDIERPRNNSRTVRFFYPEENSHRFAAEYDQPDVGPFEELGLHLFYGRYGQTTDQDRFATATSPRSVDRAEVRAHDFQFRGYGRRALGQARWDVGVDVNGRTGLQALDIFERYTLAGARTVTENVAIDSARRVDSAVYSSLEAAVLPTVTLAGGARVDHISTTNRGGFFGDRDTSNGAASGYVAVTAGSYGGFTLTAQAARGFRDPVLSDRYFRGPSGRGFVTGNPDLDPEQSLQFDAGVRYTARRVRAALFAYQYPYLEAHRAFPDHARRLLLPQPGQCPPARRGTRDAGRPAMAAVGRGRRSGGARPRPRRQHLSGRHHDRDRIGAGAAVGRCPGLRAGPPGALCHRRSARTDRARRARLHARRPERRRHRWPSLRAASADAQRVRRGVLRQPGRSRRRCARTRGIAHGRRSVLAPVATGSRRISQGERTHPAGMVGRPRSTCSRISCSDRALNRCRAPLVLAAGNRWRRP